MRHIKRALRGKEGSEELTEVMLMREFGWTPQQLDEMPHEEVVRITRILSLMSREESHVYR